MVVPVRLREVLEVAERRGAASPPLFFSASLLRRVAQALGAPAAAAASFDVSLDFAGRVTVVSSGAPAVDVAEAALLLDRLMGEQLDAELTRLIHEARLPGTDVDAAALERRLGHWLVKQHQLFVGQDLVAEWLAWLLPGDAPRPATPAVAAWFESTRAQPLAPARAATPVVAPPRRWPLVLAAVTLTGAVGLALFSHDEVEPAAPPPVPLTVLAPPTPPTPPTPPAAPAPTRAAPPLPGPALPRHLSGPTTATLSGAVHGLELERAGLAVKAVHPTWALRIAPRDPRRAPPYAALFVAQVDASGRIDDVSVVSTQWKTLDQRRAAIARVFAVQPDHPPDEGTFGLQVGEARGNAVFEHPAEARKEIFTDAMAQQEGRRLIIDSLDPQRRYQVTVTSPPRPGAWVVVSVTAARGPSRSFRGEGLLLKGTPIDQTLLQPGVPVEVKGVTRLSFVVLTTADTRAAEATVAVTEVGAPPTARPLIAPENEATVRELEGDEALRDHEPRQAAEHFRHCLKLAPDRVDCEVKLQRALRLLQ